MAVQGFFQNCEIKPIKFIGNCGVWRGGLRVLTIKL